VSEGQAPPPPPELAHGETVTLDLLDGYNGYVEAMEATLNRIKAAGYPGDPRDSANTMIFEVFNYLEGLLPNIDVREVAAFYGAVVGLGAGGHIASGELDESFVDYLGAIFYSAMTYSKNQAITMRQAMDQAEETGLVDKDGNPLASIGPAVTRIPTMKAKRHGGKKRKRKKKK
jgi:hypothetical protein